MTLYFGRVNYPTGITDPSSWVEQGDTVTCSGWLRGTSASHGLALRQQMTGYVDNRDEPFVHLASTTDATYGGFYTVEAMQVAAVLGSTTAYQWSATLRRVTGYALAQLEQLSVGAVRANSTGVVASTCLDTFWIGNNAYPSTAELVAGTAVLYNTRTVDPILTSSTTAGTTYGIVATNPAISKAVAYQNESSSPTADPYVGHARLEVSYDSGTTYQLVVGTNIPDLGNCLWRLSNGLIRFTGDTSATGKFFISGSNNTTPASPPVFTTAKAIGFYNGAAWIDTLGTQPYGLTVLRNSTTETIIRLHFYTTIPTIDIAIRPFESFVIVKMSGDGDRAYGVRVVTSTAATAITGGLRATSNDAAGHRFVFSSTLAWTNDLTNGAITLVGSVSLVTFAVGLELNGSSAVAPWRAADMVNRFMWASSHSMRVVGR